MVGNTTYFLLSLFIICLLHFSYFTPIPFTLCCIVTSLSLISSLSLLLLKQFPHPRFTVPLTLSYIYLLLSFSIFLFHTFICSSYHNFNSRFLSMTEYSLLLIRTLPTAENILGFPHILKKASWKLPHE
jgi:hypothetical protein